METAKIQMIFTPGSRYVAELWRPGRVKPSFRTFPQRCYDAAVNAARNVANDNGILVTQVLI